MGTSGVAAIVTGHRFFFLLQAINIALSIAASALISQAWGSKNIEEAGKIATTSIVMSALIALILSLPPILVPEFIAQSLGIDEQAAEQAAIFIRYLALFNVVYALNLMLSSVLRAVGDTINPLILAFASTTANIVLAWSFSFGAFGIPAQGIAGVGIGAGVGCSITCLIFFVLWLNGRFQLDGVWKDALTKQRFARLLRIGMPVAIEQSVIQFSLLAFLAIVAVYGTEAYAAYGIGVTILSLSFVIGIGFGLANATMTGQLIGAGKPELAKASGWKTMWLAVAIMTLFALGLALGARTLASFMTDDPEVIELATNFIRILAIAQPIMAVEYSLAGALRGAGDTRFPLISTFTGLFFGRILLALLFIQWELSVYWIFSVALIDFSIKASLLVWRYHSGRWQHKMQYTATLS
jgi:putative MATE family efflux protein